MVSLPQVFMMNFMQRQCTERWQDTVVVVGTDMLLVPPNVADKVRNRFAKKYNYTGTTLFFCKPSHCGPGAWAPGVAGKVTGGKYNPAIVDHLQIVLHQQLLRLIPKWNCKDGFRQGGCN
jgi:hypothetical protein